MGLGGTGLEGLTSGPGGGAIPSSPHLLQNFGVVGAPELAFEGDQDTGLYRPAVNTLGLVAGAVELARISLTGAAFFNAGSDPAGNGGDLGLSAGVSGAVAVALGGDVNITAGDTNSSSGQGIGGSVVLKAGDGIGAGQGDGGSILAEVGIPTSSPAGASGDYFVNTTVGLTADGGLQVAGTPGLVSIYGVGRTADGTAGNLELWGGYAAGANGFGGDLLLFGGGQGGGPGEGGNAHLYGGESDSVPGFAEVEGGEATVAGIGGGGFVRGGAGIGGNNAGGVAEVVGGAGAGSGDGGVATVRGGAATTSGDGGQAAVRGGAGAATNGGGQVNIIGGASGAGATGQGGPVQIAGGASLATNGEGGSIFISSGAGAGSGPDGDIFFDLGGVTQFRVSTVGLHAEVGSGPALLNVGASGSVPNIIPNQAENDTGYTRSGVDQLSHVCGGVEALRVRATTNTIGASSNLAVWSYDESALKFISFGADDSAGAGFKTCRVTN